MDYKLPEEIKNLVKRTKANNKQKRQAKRWSKKSDQLFLEATAYHQKLRETNK